MAGPQYLPDDSFGDFVRNWDDECDLEMVVEPCDRYDPESTSRVFYPICLGEVLNGRYLIEHKIGFGGGSTVWMAHDLLQRKDVALKVMALGEWAENEIRMQNEIIQHVQDTSSLVTYLDAFILPRDNDHHQVLVFPLMGPCVDPVLLLKMPPTARMPAARKLLEALEKLHQAGIVHRDLNDRNSLGRPLRQVIDDIDLWKRGELVQPLQVPESLRTEDFYIGDFALAKKVGPACDMWSYMILFSELYLGIPPFSTLYPGGILSAITKNLGPLPEEWKGLYVFSGGLDSWYDQSQGPDPDSLEFLVSYHRPDADPTERQHLLTLMKKMFTYCPEERLTATQLLQDPSFKAIMNNYAC
ncbi:hypothetical protein AnigIFM50267_008618 [Aspergillus niger]|nr:hypothetical protein AnigIFM50267_008618 [Aspergillus niger]GLA20047.1 hypothetical protein AnigIFM62618_008173 [Aspergillus niger]